MGPAGRRPRGASLALAREIPEQPLREDALSALRDKRYQTDGAALFSILPRARNPNLLRLLVAYQIIWDFLDSASERAPPQVRQTDGSCTSR